MTDLEFMTWEQFDTACQMIKRLFRGTKFLDVFGIPRGGLVVAVRLSHLMDIPLIVDRTEITRGTLIVDDIADSGGTLEPFRSNMTATLYYHKRSKVIPTAWMYEKTVKWIVFPWEAQ